jgi:hypothetical protein
MHQDLSASLRKKSLNSGISGFAGNSDNDTKSIASEKKHTDSHFFIEIFN